MHFINQTTKTTRLYEKHIIHERYTYDYTSQTYISTKYKINMSYIHLKSNIKKISIHVNQYHYYLGPPPKPNVASISLLPEVEGLSIIMSERNFTISAYQMSLYQDHQHVQKYLM
jgi:hypothetical protein